MVFLRIPKAASTSIAKLFERALSSSSSSSSAPFEFIVGGHNEALALCGDDLRKLTRLQRLCRPPPQRRQPGEQQQQQQQQQQEQQPLSFVAMQTQYIASLEEKMTARDQVTVTLFGDKRHAEDKNAMDCQPVA